MDAQHRHAPAQARERSGEAALPGTAPGFLTAGSGSAAGRLQCAIHADFARALTDHEFAQAATFAELILDDLKQAGLAHCARQQANDAEGGCRHWPLPAALPETAPSKAPPPGHAGHPCTPEHARELVRLALDTAAADLAHPLELKEMAERLHLNAAYLSALITETTGSSFRQHLHDLRLARAKALLADPTLQIAEIACALGFAIPNSFRLAFKHWTGLAPCVWRETH
jgi:AraC-like DNA-binding protein